MPKIKLGVYRHFKGGHYRVIGVATHTETKEEMVIYERLYNNPNADLEVRPLSMFSENVTRDGKTQPRFTYIGTRKPRTKSR